MNKKIIGLAVGIALLAPTSLLLAHGGNSNSAWYANPADNNCMGQLARMHAQDEKFGTKGIPASLAESNHPNFHEHGKTATVKQSMQGFQAYCKAD